MNINKTELQDLKSYDIDVVSKFEQLLSDELTKQTNK